jgi:hypothetical protein
LGKNIQNAEALLDTRREISIEVCVNVSSPHCMKCNIKVPNKSLKNVAKLKYFIMMVRNQNCIHAEIKDRLNLGNFAPMQLKIYFVIPSII